MQRFAYKNAKSEDLLKVMSEVSGKDMIEVFTPWITQRCFPQISVIRMSKNRYLIRQDCYKDQSRSLFWPIPISFISVKDGSIKGSFIMKTKELDMEFPNFEEDDFLKFNHNLSSLFITKYLPNRFEIEDDSQLKEIQGLLTNN